MIYLYRAEPEKLSSSECKKVMSSLLSEIINSKSLIKCTRRPVMTSKVNNNIVTMYCDVYIKIL